MKGLHHGFGGLIWMVLWSALMYAGTPGSFRGTIVEGPRAAAEKNWIYVEARNGMVRRVEISHAHVEYDEGVPAKCRLQDPQRALKTGIEVRITAEQGSEGEWRAKIIEILGGPDNAPSPKSPAKVVKN